MLCEQQPKLGTQNLTCDREVQNDNKSYLQMEEQALHTYNLRPGSSETDGIKISTV